MTEPPKIVTGDNGLVDWLNAIRQMIIERTPLKTPECDIDYTARGFRLKPKLPPGAEASGTVERFTVIREYKDYIVGHRATADLGADTFGRAITEDSVEVRIAKPDWLRATPWDVTPRGGIGTGPVDNYFYQYSDDPIGQRVRTLADASQYGLATVLGGNSVSWVENIYPPYLFADPPTTAPSKNVIYAIEVKQAPLFRVTEDGVDYDISWIDRNVDGRYWRTQDRKVRVCVEGQTGPWFVLIPASNSFQED